MSDKLHKVAVGLILVSEINGKKCAALSRRGRHKIEERDGKKIICGESFEGISQPTVQGGLTEEEKNRSLGAHDALLREIREESNLQSMIIVPRMIHIKTSDIPARKSICFGAFAPEDEIVCLRFEICKSVNLVYEDDLPNIRTDVRKDGFHKPGIAMFIDDKEALIETFRRFEELRALAERRP